MKEVKLNTKNIVLISLVAVVWAYFGWKLFDYYSGEEDTVNEQLSFDNDLDLKKVNPRMTYRLEVIERDPFLHEQSRKRYVRKNSVNGTNHLSETKTNKNNKNKRLGSDATQEDIISDENNWPEIIFKGIVENPKTKQKAALIIYNKHESFYLIGDKIANCELVEFNASRAILSNSNGNKEYSK